ncbi:hypothetical protein COE08_21595 [Priestia megaterium]|uniref:hypothetical protein n=1 Tax=Priestia megaterium TaxID=1404 RepID=UPI000BFB71B8|nr:hypothetical protein [Priestia megaterium]PGX17474.1 hypothetical protein COE08_21595 [Priestia megaterium]
MSPIDGKPIDEKFFNDITAEAIMKSRNAETPELALKYLQVELLNFEIILETKKNSKGATVPDEQLSMIREINVNIQKSIQVLTKYIEDKKVEENK